MREFKSKYPALKATVDFLGERPSFRNVYKNGRTFKWVCLAPQDRELIKPLIEHAFPDCAVKNCSWGGILLWIPRSHAGEKERQRWLKQSVGSSYLESLHDVLSARAAVQAQRR